MLMGELFLSRTNIYIVTLSIYIAWLLYYSYLIDKILKKIRGICVETKDG